MSNKITERAEFRVGMRVRRKMPLRNGNILCGTVKQIHDMSHAIPTDDPSGLRNFSIIVVKDNGIAAPSENARFWEPESPSLRARDKGVKK